MAATLRICLVSRERRQAGNIEIRLQSRGYQVITLTRFSSVLGAVYSDPPDIVIVDLSHLCTDVGSIVTGIKGDIYFSAIPVIGLVDRSASLSFDWDSYPLDDFVTFPINYPELFSRIDLSLRRLQRVFDNNPLTRLPGNTSIQNAIENAIGSAMAVCYIDINHFKPYNDIYGFSHGDEALRMLARIMYNGVKESGGGFAGHIGGDDFVYIVPLDRAEQVAATIMANFDTISPELFGDEEKSNGYYLALNRKGEEDRIPLLSIAIGIVPLDSPKINHCGKVAEVAAELKKRAKKASGSFCVMDNRRR